MMLRIFALVIVCIPFAAQALILNPLKGKVEFQAVGRPAAIKINGQSPGPQGELKTRMDGTDQILDGEIQLDLEKLDTGIGMRDRHMKEKYLETGKFKNAVLKLKSARIPVKILNEGGDAQVKALLSLHGVEKPVDLEMKFTKAGSEITNKSSFKIQLTDYGIEIPKFSGITVANDVQVEIETRGEGKDLVETL